MQRYVEAVAVIETQCSMDGGLAPGADGHCLQKALLKRLLYASNLEGTQRAIAGEALHYGTILLTLAFGGIFGARHLGKLAHQTNARFGQVQLAPRKIQILKRHRQAETCRAAL